MKKKSKTYKRTKRVDRAFMKAQDATIRLRFLMDAPYTPIEIAHEELEKAFSVLDSAHRLLNAEMCSKQFYKQ